MNQVKKINGMALAGLISVLLPIAGFGCFLPGAQDSSSVNKDKSAQSRYERAHDNDNGTYTGGSGNVNNAGSTWEVRHDRTGSLNPGPGWKKGQFKSANQMTPTSGDTIKRQ